MSGIISFIEERGWLIVRWAVVAFLCFTLGRFIARATASSVLSSALSDFSHLSL